MTISRRTVLKGAAATAAALTAGNVPAFAQPSPLRIGFMTIKTGQMASAGNQLEQALSIYLNDRNNTLAGRPVQLFTVDTANTPALARSKTQELVESRNVHCLIGPTSAFEALAIDDYIRRFQIPTIGYAAAEDMTQRQANPWFVRPTSTSAQCSYPMADYAFNELKHRRVATIGEDSAYGQEQVGGFHLAFEAAGGKIVQKLWSPTSVPDYATYISQFKTDVDAIYVALAGSNGFRFLRQFSEYGLRDKIPLLGGMTAIDESNLRNMGDEALGIISTNWYSAELDNPTNRHFVEAMRKAYNVDPGFYAAASYTAAALLENALQVVQGRVEDKDAFMQALRNSAVADTCRGPVRLDRYGNVVGNVYIRQVERKGGRLVNTVIKTYPDVSQFWTYDPESFLKQPPYSRDFPLSRFLEQ